MIFTVLCVVCVCDSMCVCMWQFAHNDCCSVDKRLKDSGVVLFMVVLCLNTAVSVPAHSAAHHQNNGWTEPYLPGCSCKPVVTLLLRSVTRTFCCAASWTLRLCVVSRHSRNHELDWTVLTLTSELVSSYPGTGFDLLYPTSGSFVFLCTMSSERPAYLDPRDEEDGRKSVMYNYFRLEFTGWTVAMQKIVPGDQNNISSELTNPISRVRMKNSA